MKPRTMPYFYFPTMGLVAQSPNRFPFFNWVSVRGPNDWNCYKIGGICKIGLHKSISLWISNPSTRLFEEIPNSERNWFDENIYVLRQFYYKLISIVIYSTPTRNDNVRVRADLCVTSTGTWTEIDGNKLSLSFVEVNEWGVYGSIVRVDGCFASVVLNGVFYWPASIARIPFDQVFVVFLDMGNEEFRRIRTPECLDRTSNWQLTELDDKLALVVSLDERGFDVWVLNEKGSSWTNQCKVDSFPRIASGMVNGEQNTVVGGGQNGEWLVTEHKASGNLKLSSYDTKTRKTKDLYFGHVPYDPTSSHASQ